jgi:DNA polymerase III alpha subunit (gram-positive type)
MNHKNLAFIDIETTGLDPEVQEIIEIGGVIANSDFKVIDEFEIKVKPENLAAAEPEALRINRFDPAQWLFALSLPEAMKIFSEKTKDCIMVAHNVTFDYSFLQKAFSKTGVPNLMHYHRLDTISMAYAKLGKNGDAQKYSLGFLCNMFGIDYKNAHTALPDARADFELFKKLMNLP